MFELPELKARRSWTGLAMLTLTVWLTAACWSGGEAADRAYKADGQEILIVRGQGDPAVLRGLERSLAGLAGLIEAVRLQTVDLHPEGFSARFSCRVPDREALRKVLRALVEDMNLSFAFMDNG